MTSNQSQLSTTTVGDSDRIQSETTALRDQILGARRPGEDLEAYRRRSYQALAVAREIVQAEQPVPLDHDRSATDDPIVASYFSNLELIASALNQHE